MALQLEEPESVAVASRNRFGDGAEGTVSLAIEFESIRQHDHSHELAFVFPDKRRSLAWQSPIRRIRGLGMNGGRARRRQWPRRHHPHFGVVGQFRRPATRSFAEVAFGHGLQPPSDLANQVCLVPGANRLAEQFRVPFAELSGGHPLERRDLAFNVDLHRFLPGSRNR